MTLIWRPMRADDLGATIALADAIHRDHPERPEVFAERLALFPDGARALAGEDGLGGYAIAHPWAGAPPRLDTLLGALPEAWDHFYIHDVALAHGARGGGEARAAVAYFEALARGLGLMEMRLTAVSGSAPIWSKLGFTESGVAGSPGYGEDARAMVRFLSR